VSAKAAIADQAERDAALDVRRSFIVQAPAGSGKTSLLVSRYLKLLKTVQKPESVLAITFTIKAAAEMRMRVLEGLPALSIHAVDIAHRLRIQTIDAFCASLTRQLPVTARFGAQPEFIEDATALYLESSFRTLSNFSNPAVARLLAHLDNDVPQAAGLLAGVLAKRDQWLRGSGAAPTRAALELSLLSERNRLLANAKALDPGASEAFAKDVLTKDGKWRKKNPIAQKLSSNEPLRLALKALLAMPPANYDDAQWQVLEAILELLLPAVRDLFALFLERGQIDFIQLAHGALLAFGKEDAPTDLALALDYRIQHILVDEFQDTSSSQWDLLGMLTAGWQPGDGRTVFAVGDPMQSIYGFRNAQVGLFLHARHTGLHNVKLEPLTLSTNFRSQAQLVSWFNASFSKLLPEREDESSGAVPYSPSTSVESALKGEAVKWHGFYERAGEARRVVELVQKAKGKAAILVRNRAHLDRIVPALREAQIRWRAIEIEQLGEKQIVQDLFALARALSHPGDRVAWLAVLRAPWCGLTLSDLLLLTSENQNKTVWECLTDDLVLCKLSEDGQKRAFRAWGPLGQALLHRLRGTLRERVEGCWLALGGPACVASATELEDAAAFLDELERLEEAGEADMQALGRQLEELFAQPDVEAGPGAVEILTIHNAKGLEWDTVIVPGLDRIPRTTDRPLFAWKERAVDGGSLLLAPINETGADDDPIYKYVRGLTSEAEDIEAGRLFYVAATRAKQRLHLLGVAKADDDGAPKDPTKRSLLAKIWWQAQPHFGKAPAGPAQASLPLPPLAMLTRLPTNFAAPATPPAAQWTPPPEGREEEQIEFSWASETARHVGVVVHRWLQRIAEDELKGWDVKRVESLRAHFERDLKRRGVQDSTKAAELVVQAIRNSISDERGRWILGTHRGARSEQRIRAPGRSFAIDRRFVDDEGRRWVVDFKTSRHEGGNVEAFLDEQRSRYQSQLDGYARLLGDANKGIYLPLLKGWRSW
jgi:ATP-dependent exoDNAse (exonuclease V) beta subunit